MLSEHNQLLGSAKSTSKSNLIHFSQILAEITKLEKHDVFNRMNTSLDGLTQVDALERLKDNGLNVIAETTHQGWVWHLITAIRNPLVILLIVLSAVSFATGDKEAGAVMSVMVVLGVLLRFIQEARANSAAAKLKAMIRITATVVREGKTIEIALDQLVPGDIVTLSAGDMVPGDVRIVYSKDLFVSQAALTGESLPVEKFEVKEKSPDKSPLEFSNVCFLGTSIESGAATAVVVATGAKTYFGSMANSIVSDSVETSFDKGMKSFTWLMIRFMMVMVPLVFLVNGLTKHNWSEAFFFAIAVAVGLTPEMLPMIVSVCLSKGALAMSKRKVIVKQLSSIQNFGAMDVLCTDKTGTLTMDQVILEKHCDVMQNESSEVLLDAYLLAHFQTGLKNILDRAILNHRDAHEELIIDYKKVDEIPFDFVRRMMSVVVETPEKKYQLLTKGAPEAVFERCKFYELNGQILPFESEHSAELTQQYEMLSADGFRVLALAYKNLDITAQITKSDETDLILKGYVAFLDPPKDSARTAIHALQDHGITVKVLTGDNDLVTKKVCREVGLVFDTILTGHQVEKMTDAELSAAVETTHVFARLSPAQKQMIIRALQRNNHVVGFMGDGINDSPALHVADVGISVESAVDIAKAAASVILLEKNLMVLDDGVIEGRKVFVNILKYVRMGASSSFGNMLSVIGASIFLPFVPMLPIQVLTNNLLYDFSQVPIPTDTVAVTATAKPRPWSMDDIKKFVFFIGPISSIFDYTTFFVMLYVFGCWDPARAALFQTGWFIESLITQTLIIHIIRTNQIPFIQSRASWQLTMTTLIVIGIAIWLPYSPLAKALGFVSLPPLYWPILLVTLLGYVVLTQIVKMWLIKKTWI